MEKQILGKQSEAEQLSLDLEGSEWPSLLSIPAGTHYWLLRARGGKYLADFINEGFISLGFNKITMATIRDPNVVRGTTGQPDIHQLMAEAYPNDSKLAITLHTNQILQFVYEFNVGDIVIVPGRNSDQFAIGVISGAVYDEPVGQLQEKIKNRVSDGINYKLTTDIKRRPVCWIKTITRAELPKNLLFALNAQQTILRIEQGHSSINKLISPLFLDENGINLVFATEVDRGLTVSQLHALAELLETSSNQQDLIRVDTEKNSPIALTFMTAFNNSAALHQLLMSIVPYAHVAGTGIAGGGILFTLKQALAILGGEQIKKDGVVKWFQDRHSQFLDNKLKSYQVNNNIETSKDSKPNPGIQSLKAHLKTSGTEIVPHNPTTFDTSPALSKKKKHKREGKGKTSKSDDNQGQKEKK